MDRRSDRWNGGICTEGQRRSISHERLSSKAGGGRDQRGTNIEREMKKIAKKQEHKKDGKNGTVVAGGRNREERKEEEGMELVGVLVSGGLQVEREREGVMELTDSQTPGSSLSSARRQL